MATHVNGGIDSALTRIVRVRHAVTVALAALGCRDDAAGDPDEVMAAVQAILMPAAGDLFWLNKHLAGPLDALVAPDNDDLARMTRRPSRRAARA